MGYDRVYPIIFPEYLTHIYVGTVLKIAIEEESKLTPVICSAGFCNIHEGRYIAEHGSESLNMKKNKREDSKDARILNMPNAMQGMV